MVRLVRASVQLWGVSIDVMPIRSYLYSFFALRYPFFTFLIFIPTLFEDSYQHLCNHTFPFSHFTTMTSRPLLKSILFFFHFPFRFPFEIRIPERPFQTSLVCGKTLFILHFSLSFFSYLHFLLETIFFRRILFSHI